MNCSKPFIHIFLSTLFFLCVLLCFSNSANASSAKLAKEGYQIKLKVAGMQDTACYLAYHYGHKIFIQDTFQFDKKGNVVFKGEEALPGGIYLAVIPGKKYFEFLVNPDEQHFSLDTDTTDYIKNMKVKGSEENKLFMNYQQFMIPKQRAVAEARKLQDTTESEDSLLMLDEKIETLNAEMNDYRLALSDKHPKSFIATIINTMQEPQVDTKDLPKDETGKTEPQAQFKYIKTHFWDNVDFTDKRLVRTPLIYNKISKYLEQLTVRHPDSINVSADVIIEKARANEDAFKYAVAYITNTYETSKIMGMDAVFVHMAQKYYLTGEAFWVDSVVLGKVKDRVDRLKHNLIGKKAPNLVMEDLQGKKHTLYDLDTDYCLVLFWDYNCGHCKKQMPDYIELYDKFKDKNIEVFAICTRIEKDKFAAYVDEAKLPWINVYDPYNRTRFREYYDIHSTPTAFLLDKDKTILAKRLGPKQISNLLENLTEEKAEE